ncbi:MAG: hypothetical protein Q9160_004043 [Pyrenula sp. 1 TL-2023]
MPKLKVLICGGGIAGNALAFWLSKQSHDVTVLERFPDLRSTGLQIDLRGHGVEVLKRMGLEQAFREKSVQEKGLEMVDSSGRRRAWFPANKSGKGSQSFTSDFEIMRGDFVRLIYDATKDWARYLFGKSVESFQNLDSSIEVTFSDGEKDHFDLLVGADGLGSHTRKMMLGPDAADPLHFVGQFIAYFTIPRPIQKGEEYISTTYLAPGRRFLFTRRSNPDQVQVYLIYGDSSERLKNVRKGDVKDEKAAFTEIFRGAGWRTDEFLQSMEHADDFYCERPALVKLNSWYSDRVVLVGDAAYSPTPNAGMGTTSGIVGAYILAGEIEKHCGNSGSKDELATALKAYDRTFRPFMGQVQHGISENRNHLMFPSTPLGIAILNIILGLVALLRLDLFVSWISREKMKDWALPDYDEMAKEKA